MSTHPRSRRFLGLASLLLPVAFCASPSVALGAFGDCSGDTGYVLTIPPQVEIGSSLVVSFEAPQGGDLFLLVSTGPGPTDTPIGQLCVSFPPVYIFHIPLPNTGKLSLVRELPCDPGLVGFTGYFQFVGFATKTRERGISNQATMTLTTGPCDDRFCSYTQGAWGQACDGGNVGCLRDAHFQDVFPKGLLLGDQDGLDGDSLFAVVLTDAKAVEDFLPQNATSGTLDADATNPIDTTAGVFAGQLAAAKLALGFDDAGVFDNDKNGNLIGLGDVIFVSCVDEDLIGLSVRQVIAIADRVISGEFGVCDQPGCQSDDIYDANGDGFPDVSIDDLNTALNAVNVGFDECKPIGGCFGNP